MAIVGKAAAIIVAGGKGTRMGTEEYKQFLPIRGVPVLARTVSCFEAHDSIREIILVVPDDSIQHCSSSIVDGYGFKKVKKIIAGGEIRQESVYEGLLQARSEIILIHDGVRPFVSENVISAVINTAEKFGACTVGTPATDTLKTADRHLNILDTLDRESIYAVQTPQGFRKDLIITAHEKAKENGFIGTDDAALAENIGASVKIVPGEKNNIKITTPDDLLLAEFYAESWATVPFNTVISKCL